MEVAARIVKERLHPGEEGVGAFGASSVTIVSAQWATHWAPAQDSRHETTRSIADYTAAIAIDPKYDLPYFNRANIYARLKQNDKALADFRLKLLHVLMFLHATGRL